MSAHWRELELEDPTLAEFGRERIDGKVSYLATLRRDGSLRLHPVTPILGGGYCFIFIGPSSPRAYDLRNQGQYCLHCAMNDSSGSSGEFQMSGIARMIEDQTLRQLAQDACIFRPGVRYLLFELGISEVMSTSYRGGRVERRRWTLPATLVSC